MLKVILCCGIPSSGKSTWAKAEIAKDPQNWVRINNDDLRLSFNGGEWSSEYEKLIVDTRNYLITQALKKNKNVVIDNLNLNKRHFEGACELAKKSGRDVQVLEKHFYIDLDEAIARDAKREGRAKVGEAVIKKWWKESGKEQFKFYKPKTEIFLRTETLARDKAWEPMVQDENLPKAIICDLDGTIAGISHRSPYDASKCLDDTPMMHVVELVQQFYQNGYKIIFCSGRENKFRDLTIQWLDTYVNVKYDLFMRPTSNFEKDCVIKENIFNEQIKDKYYVRAVIDDRKQVCQLWHRLGLPLFRVGDPEANF